MESPPADREGRWKVVKQSVEQLQSKGLLSAMDIVLNHCAGALQRAFKPKTPLFESRECALAPETAGVRL